MQAFSRRALLAIAAPFAVATGCISPTLPLPPPDRPNIESIGSAQYRLTGSVPEQSLVLVENQETGLIYGQADTVAYSIVVAAHPRDTMLLWYVVGDKSSEGAIFQIPAAAVADGGAPPAVDGASTVRDR